MCINDLLRAGMPNFSAGRCASEVSRHWDVRVEDAMISLEDCIAFCGLDEDEVAAISEHEHIPEIAATALAAYMLKQPHGGEEIRTMIVDDIHKALDAGRVKHAQELFMALRHFLDQHPEARAGVEA
jgi:hypothetical protein